MRGIALSSVLPARANDVSDRRISRVAVYEPYSFASPCVTVTCEIGCNGWSCTIVSAGEVEAEIALRRLRLAFAVTTTSERGPGRNSAFQPPRNAIVG